MFANVRYKFYCQKQCRISWKPFEASMEKFQSVYQGTCLQCCEYMLSTILTWLPSGFHFPGYSDRSENFFFYKKGLADDAPSIFSIFISSLFQSIYTFFGCPSLGVRPWWSRRGSGKNLRSRLSSGPEAEAGWLRCPLARESGRGLNSSTAEQSAA